MACWSAPAGPLTKLVGPVVGRSQVALLLDAGFVAVAYVLTWMIQHPGLVPELPYLVPLFLLVPTCLAVEVLLNLHNCSWRFVTLQDVCGIALIVSVATGAYAMIRWWTAPPDLLPAVILFWFILFAALVFPRICVRQVLGSSMLGFRAAGRRVPVLIAGAPSSVEGFLRSCRSGQGAERRYRPYGLLVPAPAEQNRTLHGIPLLGTYDNFRAEVESLRRSGVVIEQIILAGSGADMTPQVRRALCETAEALSIQTMRLPSITDFEQSGTTTIDGQPISIIDLLGRRPAAPHQKLGERLIAGARVLITGAGGTIGSELSRQIVRLRPAELVLIDNCEYNSYRIALQISEAGHGDVISSFICDVRDSVRVQQIVAERRPEIIFHAAALKHVPIVESHPAEGVLTNILGTCNVADAALAYGCRLMIFISTDKAVDPTTIMGATKRIAECYCQSIDAAVERGSARFVAVRFGNVAGSSGSVIPLFARQISRGGPITVSHPDARRFFMTIEEAVKLVLSASACSCQASQPSPQVYILEMGEPIRIVELGAQMARMAGLAPGRDIRIDFVGLEPGEKLEEVLFCRSEMVVKTNVPGVLGAISAPTRFPLLRSLIDDLVEAARDHNSDEVRRLLQHTFAACNAHVRTDPPRRQPLASLFGQAQAAMKGT